MYYIKIYIIKIIEYLICILHFALHFLLLLFFFFPHFVMSLFGCQNPEGGLCFLGCVTWRTLKVNGCYEK